MPARLLALTALVDDGVLAGMLSVAHRTGAPLPFALDFTVLARALDALLLPMGRQYRMEVLSVVIHVGIVRTAAVGQDGLRGPERTAATALVAHFVRAAGTNRFPLLDLRAHLAAGLLVRPVGHLVAAVQRRALGPRAVDFQCCHIAGAHGAGVVAVRRQVRVPGRAGFVELVAELATAGRRNEPGVVGVFGY